MTMTLRLLIALLLLSLAVAFIGEGNEHAASVWEHKAQVAATWQSRDERDGDHVMVEQLRLENPAQVLGYPVEFLPRGNTTVLAMQVMGNGLLQVVALGKNGQLWHVYQKSVDEWVSWKQLTTVCPSAQDLKRPCKFDGDPAVGRNVDGRLEIFARFHENLDLWQMHQTDTSNPETWSMPRESSCVDQDQSTAIWSCLGGGMPAEQTESHYWIIDSPAFPTSDLTVLNNPKEGTIQVYFRNFEGHLFRIEQLKAGDSSRYSTPQVVASNVLFI